MGRYIEMPDESHCLYCGRHVAHGMQMCPECMAVVDRRVRRYRALPHLGLCKAAAYGAMLAGLLVVVGGVRNPILTGVLLICLGLGILYLTEGWD